MSLGNAEIAAWLREEREDERSSPGSSTREPAGSHTTTIEDDTDGDSK